MRKIFYIFMTWCFGACYAAASDYVACNDAEISEGTCFNCGTTCSARYSTQENDDGTLRGILTVSGYGEMDATPYYYDENFETHRTSAPWKDLAGEIKEVIIEEGITSVGERNFYRVGVETVVLPESLLKIGLGAFQQTNLNALELPPNLKTIESGAFATSYFEDLFVPASVISTDSYCFGSSTLKTLTVEGDTNLKKEMFYDSSSIISPYLTSVYCNSSNISCQALLDDADIGSKIKFYEQKGKEYFYNGKFYKNPSDIASGNYDKKRIYTIEEANAVAGDRNTVRIKYR